MNMLKNCSMVVEEIFKNCSCVEHDIFFSVFSTAVIRLFSVFLIRNRKSDLNTWMSNLFMLMWLNFFVLWIYVFRLNSVFLYKTSLVCFCTDIKFSVWPLAWKSEESGGGEFLVKKSRNSWKTVSQGKIKSFANVLTNDDIACFISIFCKR